MLSFLSNISLQDIKNLGIGGGITSGIIWILNYFLKERKKGEVENIKTEAEAGKLNAEKINSLVGTTLKIANSYKEDKAVLKTQLEQLLQPLLEHRQKWIITIRQF